MPHPPQRLSTKLPTVWSEEQIEQLINSVDITTPIGKRDYAMILLGARLGLRIGDILSLTLNDIDWSKKLITITQSKTKEPLSLPLPDDAGWAIIDYLKNGRPVTDYPNIFVTHNAPYKGSPFKSTLRHNINKALKRAGIPIDKAKTMAGIPSVILLQQTCSRMKWRHLLSQLYLAILIHRWPNIISGWT